jgi:hypothetical protein
MGMGNRQPIKQFKPSPRVGMATGGNINVVSGGSGVPVRPGTAGGSNSQTAQAQYQKVTANASSSKGLYN